MVNRFGARIGAYEILYELKTGGMGAVLLGRRRGPGAFEQLVAIKTIRADHAQSPVVRAMFLDEAAILARLTHPAIATVHDFGEQGGSLYMVMEYVAGIAFREIMLLGMPPAVAARAVAEACRGLHAAHELRDLAGNLLGVVHRDISPDNLMIGFDGHVKVIDFGIALIKNRQAPVTELGMLKGKPPYMSPEQVKNEVIGPRSDVFSLAVVLWELLTGTALFEGDSIYAVARAVEHQEIRRPSQVLGAPLPAGLDAVVMSALERDPARRIPTAAAFAEQLEQVIQTAGDETLEAWADRVLDDARTAHRAWLASVVAGVDAPRPLGRSTGAVTAIAPLGKAPTLIAPRALLPERKASPQSDAVDDGLDVPPRRRLGWPLVLVALALGIVGGGIAYLRYLGAPHEASHADARGADAAVIVRAEPPLDAAHDEPTIALDAPEAIVDAATPPAQPLDAGHRRSVRPPLDAGRPIARDPVTAPATVIDAAQAGWGALIAKHKGERYLSVVVDGRYIGPTPMFRQKISSGTHVIELVDAKTSEVVVRRTVTVEVGEAVTVVEP